ncbi:copper amine oxidase N-terminal domain-containing protein [Caloranaerobacter azorensis]|uniref:Copper amine oxidase N-terminal domain-containing protein n=1 Tax=Caloranaerobacter azorensis TaxID=116090 RepID=A0A6P1YFG7_9FIRM|nr:copper amine oxidase N-terminal domain-containing protein [Caloranaerobacter azorensis]QIB27934.1 copper amine oxidase N-terminal domain-containing protein [Caloranaerobacter azorensis]
MKKISIFLVIILLMNVVGPLKVLADEQSIKVSINGKLVEFDVPPTIINGRTLVPVRAILEQFGLKVDWDNETRTVIGKKDGLEIKLPVDNKKAQKNGEEIKIDVPATIINGRTLVPIRFIAESIGAKVDWDDKTKTVIITSSAKMNPFSLEKLKQLVENTPVDKEILEFRKKPNKRRNGLKKIEGKYFDLYYPDDDKAKAVAEFLKPYMDTAYIYLVELYGQQAPVEVHLIHEKDAENLKEGDIRRKENVTFVWIEPNNDDGGNNIAELVHEMHHNFFKHVNNNWSWADDKWSSFVDESLAKLLPSLYVKNVYDGKTDMWDIESDYTRTLIGIKKSVGNDFVTLDEAVDKYLGKPRSWGRAEGRHRIAQNTALAFWMYVYNEYGIEKIKEVLRTIGKGNYKPKLEKIFNKSTEELSDELINVMKESYDTYSY